MIWDPLSIWQLLGLFALSLAATLATEWLVNRRLRWNAAIVVWVPVLFAAGVVAARYSERLAQPAWGYLAFALGAVALSLLRAYLHRRAEKADRPPPGPTRRRLLRSLTYLLAAAVILLLGAWLLDRSLEPWLFLPLGLGALLPALDGWPPLARFLEARWGDLPVWRTPPAAGFVALVSLPLLLVNGTAWLSLPLGFLVRLAVDTLHPPGVMWLWPLRETRYRLREGPLPWSQVAGGLALAAALLLFQVRLGPPPPPPAPAPTFAQVVDRYYSLRGRNLVFVYVEGSWQIGGRRSSGRFEVINAEGSSLILLDRYTGRVFRAGHGAEDDFYPTYISLQTGAAARIKPVEVHLEDQRLAGALPVLYQMQTEPGLQYIFVSGEVVGGELPTDHPQNSIPKIESVGEDHYRLRYLTAAELIALADRRVQTADLVIWATYVVEVTPTEPTVTPLPGW